MFFRTRFLYFLCILFNFVILLQIEASDTIPVVKSDGAIVKVPYQSNDPSAFINEYKKVSQNDLGHSEVKEKYKKYVLLFSKGSQFDAMKIAENDFGIKGGENKKENLPYLSFLHTSFSIKVNPKYNIFAGLTLDLLSSENNKNHYRPFSLSILHVGPYISYAKPFPFFYNFNFYTFFSFGYSLLNGYFPFNKDDCRNLDCLTKMLKMSKGDVSISDLDKVLSIQQKKVFSFYDFSFYLGNGIFYQFDNIAFHLNSTLYAFPVLGNLNLVRIINMHKNHDIGDLLKPSADLKNLNFNFQLSGFFFSLNFGISVKF